MVIRAARRPDAEALTHMGFNFARSTPYGALFPVTPGSLSRLANVVFDLGDRAVTFVAEDDAVGPFGMLTVLAAPNLITGETYGDELVWWVEPPYRGGPAGKAMLKAAEGWAHARELKLLKMVAPVGSDLGLWYRRMGYQEIETVYAKVLR